MFGGIINHLGVIKFFAKERGKVRLGIQCSTLSGQDFSSGESIAVNGVCLTLLQATDNGDLSFDICQESLDCTTVHHWQIGDKVNLESALCYQERVGGHLISGHVDDIGSIINIVEDCLRISYPQPLRGGICRKGNIAVDGMSLTINDTTDDWFEVFLIPHTLEHSIAHTYQTNYQVNLEIDMLARYIIHNHE